MKNKFLIKREMILTIPQLNIIDKALECYEDKLMKNHKLDGEQFSYEFYNVRARIKGLFELNESMVQSYETQREEE